MKLLDYTEPVWQDGDDFRFRDWSLPVVFHADEVADVLSRVAMQTNCVNSEPYGPIVAEYAVFTGFDCARASDDPQRWDGTLTIREYDTRHFNHVLWNGDLLRNSKGELVRLRDLVDFNDFLPRLRGGE